MTRRQMSLGTALMLSVTACGLPARSLRERALENGPILMAAGFRAVPASSPDKREFVAHMEPARMFFYKPPPSLDVPEATSDVQSDVYRYPYWYVDPYFCKCVYVGDPESYRLYTKKVVALELESGREAASSRDAALIQLLVSSSTPGETPRRKRIVDESAGDAY